ncbi:MAG TPA: Flp family type IVb pilin [Acidimicrobiales bacterium]|nr:Flp family type IVb pilin [Acidimicrobiales bacterium]
MTQLFMQTYFAVRGVNSQLWHRARSERGASMVEYALLVGLIAIVAVVALIALGPAIASLFDKASNCVSNPTNTTCP